MFKFNRVLNATTGVWYYFDRAQLVGDEYDPRKNGGNAYTVDLQPLYDIDAKPLTGLTLSVGNSGDYAMLTKNLDREQSTHSAYSKELGHDLISKDMSDCIVDGDTLIVTAPFGPDIRCRLCVNPPESAAEAIGMVKALRAVMEVEGRALYEIEKMAQWVSDLSGGVKEA